MRARLIALAVLALSLAAAAPAGANVGLQRVGSFAQPVDLRGAPQDYRRLFVVEKGGTIRVVRDGRTLATPFADLSGVVRSEDERGLLSLAFAPDYESSRRLYVYFTDAEGDIRVEELRRSSRSRDRADPASRRTLLEIPHKEYSNHNGGQLQFGPDGLLYISTGDGGGGNNPLGTAQRLSSRLGKILRIDPRAAAGAPYRVPASNPFVGVAGAAPEIWSIGLRNPFRFSFSPSSRALVIGDVGQSEVEEIDYSPRSRGAGRGANYGWVPFEGNTYRPEYGPAPAGNERPVIERLHSRDGVCAITGGYVVRDHSLPSLVGRYVYGDLCDTSLRSARLAVPRATDDRLAGATVSQLSSFGQDSAGCLYALSIEGSVSRLVDRRREFPCRDRSGPRLRVSAPSPQRVLAHRGVLARVRCDERCSVGATGTLRAGSRVFRLGSTRRTVGYGRSARLRLGLSTAARRAVSGALAAGSPVRARIALRALDRARNRSGLARRTVRARR